MSVSQSVQGAVAKAVLAYLDSDPDKNLKRLLTWLDKFDVADSIKKERDGIREILENPNGNWYRLIKSFWTDIDTGVRRKFFENFIVNASILGKQKQDQAREKFNCNIPWAILLDPTSACNLQCTGCWAAEYGNKLSLDYSILDSIIRQGKELGVHFFIYSGGEPLVRKDDIIKLCEKYPECQFLAFTNGTLIDENFAAEMLRVKNFVPAISIEGGEEATDSRRGAGTYQRVRRAMEILQERKLLFGVSCCYTKDNTESIGSEEFYDTIIDCGAKFAWFFTYIPVGKNAVPELIASPDQREYMYHQVRNFRKTKPIFTMDFWNDGEFAGGCIAGGRRYLHINANGDIEPCAFIHYSDSNIKEKTLVEAFQSPLFMEYKERQPFNKNHLRPCPLLDNPLALAAMVKSSKAGSTEIEAPEDVDILCGKTKIAAENWAPVAHRLWIEGGKGES